MTTLLGGSAHPSVPDDLAGALLENDLAEIWNGLSVLARNEWICWVTHVKQEATRQKHVRRAVQELSAGKRRPCCWMGCVHRSDKPLSPSVRGILKKRGQL